MNIISSIKLNPNQEHLIKDLETIRIHSRLDEPILIFSIKTFRNQELKLSINQDGIIVQVDIKN